MAAPSIRGVVAPVSGGSGTSPAGTQVGDLVVVVTWERAGAGIPTHTIQTANGYVEIRSQGHEDGSTDGRLSVGYKIATAAGANAYQAYTSSTGSPVWWTGLLVLQAGTFDAVTPAPAHNGVTSTGTGVPNPPALASLDNTRDYLVAAISAWHLGSALTLTPTAPANYALEWHVAGSANGDVALSTRALTGPASEDPGTYGDNQTPNGTSSITIGFINALPVVDGVLNKTLGTLTVSSTATAEVAATVSKTLDALTLDATATIQDPSHDAVLDVTLGALTVVSAARADVDAQAAPTLGAMTLSGAATAAVEGSVSRELGAATLVSAAGAVVDGAVVKTLDDLVLSAGARADVDAAVSRTLDPATLSSTVYVGSILDAIVDDTLGPLVLTSTIEATSAAAPTGGYSRRAGAGRRSSWRPIAPPAVDLYAIALEVFAEMMARRVENEAAAKRSLISALVARMEAEERDLLDLLRF